MAVKSWQKNAIFVRHSDRTAGNIVVSFADRGTGDREGARSDWTAVAGVRIRKNLDADYPLFRNRHRSRFLIHHLLNETRRHGCKVRISFKQQFNTNSC